jgi:two-component system, NtrC family, nitrogen regulation sensor histidine kinase NtrY
MGERASKRRGQAMSFRRRLLAALSFLVVATVLAIGWIISLRTKQVFEAADAARTDALVRQFQQEFQRRGDDVLHRIEAIAASESAARMALDISQGGDPGAYLTEATTQAQAHQLDFLEFLKSDGSIISSAQWPARFGYQEQMPSNATGPAFLKREDLQNASALGLFAIRSVKVGDQPVYVLGGERLDRDFLASISLPLGMRAFLYRYQDGGFNTQNLVVPGDTLGSANKLAAIIQAAQEHGGQEVRGIVHWTDNLADAESFHAIPLKTDDGNLIAVLLVGSARRGLVELLHHIRAVMLTVAAFGILAAILVSIWLSARVTRPVEELAHAAGAVAAGDWETHVDVHGTDELAQLAEAFNQMTHEIIDQRERLVQSERVAAWRELARRLAHELKNPLFPLQITVENLLRSRQLPPTEFEEIFKESTETLLAEIANLKTIVGRFSDFSKMPQPQLQRIQVNDSLKRIVALHEPQFAAPGKPPIRTNLELGDIPEIDADPDLLHRVFSNLVLNAMDAMPEGGTLTLRTREFDNTVQIEVSDSGTGLTPEECQRLFTPYYTSKQHGTGLGLAIVQSVISDHRGSIAVESEPGKGATFRIELPKHLQSALKAEPAKVG